MSGVVVARRAFCAALGSCSVVLASAVIAQDSPQVIITASRAEEGLAETFWSASVLSDEDIRARQATSVQELLATIPGVNVNNSGGLGKLTTVFIRGAESDHTLFLVDGVRVGSATAGFAPVELLPVHEIERIEVVRGPRSTLYGSDAVGGVVQLFTRGGPRRGLSMSASASAGSHETRTISADLHAAGERAWLGVSAESLATDGFNSCLGAGAPIFAGCGTVEPDADGFRNTSGTLSAGYRLAEGWKAQVRTLLADGRTEFDGSFTNVTKFDERVASLQIDGALSGNWSTRLIVGRNENTQDSGLDGDYFTRFETRRNTASLHFEGHPAETLRLIAGVEYTDDRVESTTEYDETSRSTSGIFAELRGDFGEWSALAGARLEDNEQFGSHTVGNLALARRIGARHRLTATWGTAFHAPTFNDLYFPGFSDPTLAPEESRSTEIGFESSFGRLLTSVHVFQTDFDELIAFDSLTFLPRNVGAARVRGAELSGEWRGDRWRILGHLTQMDPVNEGEGGQPDTLLNRRAKHSGSLDVRRSFGSGSLGAFLRWEGPRFDDLANTARLGGYFTLDLTAERALGAWTFAARVANVFDREYATARFFPQDGRNYTATVRYTFPGVRP